MSLAKLAISISFLITGAFAQECSVASLTGAYGYTLSGTVTNAENRPITNSQVGRIVFDGKGGFTGVGAVTSGAKVEVGEFTGQIAIGADCTATGKTVSSGNSTDFDLVVVNAGSDFALVLRASDATLSGNGTKVEGQGACTPSILTGTYGYQGDGVVAMDGKAVSTAEIGILTFDGKGAFSGTSSLISAGQSTRQSFTGTYELTDICFAAAVYKVGDVAYQMNFMVTGGGNQILYSELASGYVATGAGTRTFPK